MLQGIAYFSGHSINFGVISGAAIFNDQSNSYGTISGEAKFLQCAVCQTVGVTYTQNIPYKHGAYFDGYYVNNVKTGPSLEGLPPRSFEQSGVFGYGPYSSNPLSLFPSFIKPVAVFKIVNTQTYATYTSSGDFVEIIDDSRSKKLEYIVPKRYINDYYDATWVESFYYDLVENAYFKFYHGKKIKKDAYVWNMFLSNEPTGNETSVVSPWSLSNGVGIYNHIQIFTTTPSLAIGTILYANKECTVKFKDLTNITSSYAYPVQCQYDADPEAIQGFYAGAYNVFDSSKLFYAVDKDTFPKDEFLLDENGAISRILPACVSCGPLITYAYAEDVSGFCYYSNENNYLGMWRPQRYRPQDMYWGSGTWGSMFL